jgi:hypothetical protein
MNFIEYIFRITALFIAIKIGVAAGFVKYDGVGNIGQHNEKRHDSK